MSHPDPLIADAIDRARTTHPYYAAAIDGLRIVADDRVPTMATSASWVTHYNPTFAASITTAERAAVLVHEAEHLLRRHHERCGDRDARRFNIAGDAEINQRLAGLPSGAIYPETLGLPRGATAETYYGAAKADPEPDPGAGDSGDGSGAGQTGAGDGTAGGGEPTPGAGSGSGDALPHCGSAAGGPVQPHETSDAAIAGPGAGRADAVRKSVAESVLAGAGTDAGDELRAWAESEVGIDRAAWYAALAHVVGRVAAPYGAPTRWQWPGRRDARDMGGAMVPRWRGERPAAAVIIDTSSSITASDLDLARTAAYYLGRLADVTYWGCDTTADKYGASLPDVLRGGGGTALRNGIDAAIADGARAVIVITDCETAWGDTPPPVPVIIGANLRAERVLSGDLARRFPGSEWAQVPPEWATVVPVVAR